MVMHEQEIIDTILASIDKRDCLVKVISLVSDEKELRQRLMEDVNAETWRNCKRVNRKRESFMKEEKVFGMLFAKVYPMLVAKAERKGRTREEVDEVACWLTGYSRDAIAQFMNSDISYGDFFRQAPLLHPNRKLIKGSVCGVRVENIENPLMQEIRYLDKLVDELAKGKDMAKILRN